VRTVEGCPGIKRLVHVERVFGRFSHGEPGEKTMDQRQFDRFCEKMGMVNHDMSRRLFLAIDSDNTGAIDAAVSAAVARVRPHCGRMIARPRAHRHRTA
jgi:hypothetical protein